MRKLPAAQLEQLLVSIRVGDPLPFPFHAYQSTLRLAPSLGPCYTLQAVRTILGQAELKGLAEHWGKTFMGPYWATWQWKAVQVEPEQPILLCACKVDSQYLNAF